MKGTPVCRMTDVVFRMFGIGPLVEIVNLDQWRNWHAKRIFLHFEKFYDAYIGLLEKCRKENCRNRDATDHIKQMCQMHMVR